MKYFWISSLLVASLFAASCGELGDTGAVQRLQAEESEDSFRLPKHRQNSIGAKAKQNFQKGNYGNAERFYRQAVEENPRDVDSWLGLAATYDRLKKYDLANRAYTIAIKLIGYTPRVLNNLGFHYILRGEFKRARKILLAAQKKDPTNKRIQNNLNLLLKKEAEKHAS